MIQLTGTSSIITQDETLLGRRYAQTPGEDVIYIDGKPVARDFFEFNITCNVQPLNGKDLLLVPEGDRFENSMWVYQNQADTPLLSADLVWREGVWFQCQTAEDWGSYTRARIMEIDVGPDVKDPQYSCLHDVCDGTLDRR